MIVDDLDIACIFILPCETNPELIVDANAILTFAVTLKCFESVAGRDSEIGKPLCAMQINQLTPCNTLNRSETGNIPVIK